MVAYLILFPHNSLSLTYKLSITGAQTQQVSICTPCLNHKNKFMSFTGVTVCSMGISLSLSLSLRVIYKCSMCDTVFTQQSLLYTHFDQHVINHKVPVFKCPDCSSHYVQKQIMLDHIKVGTINLFDNHLLATLDLLYHGFAFNG